MLPKILCSSEKIGMLYIICAAVLWGTNGTAQAFAPSGVHPVVIGTFRLAIGGAVLLLAAFSGGLLRDGYPWPFMTTLVGALSVALFQVFFFSSVLLTGVTIGTIVTVSSAPVSAGLLGLFFLNESLSMRWGIATTFAVVGCAMLVIFGSQDIQIHPLGLLLAIAAGTSYTCYALMSRKLLQYHSANAVAAIMLSCGALLLSPIFFLKNISWVLEPRGLFVVLHLGLITGAAAFFVFSKGLKLVRVAVVATLTLAEPLTASVLGIFILGERLSAHSWFGVALLFTGLTLLATERSARRQPEL